jgi:hypothetical protein
MSTRDTPISPSAETDDQTAEQDTENAGEQDEIDENHQLDQPPDAVVDQQEPAPLPLDQIFEILKNRRRRDVLKYLKETEQRVSLGEMAEHVAALENDTTVKQISSSQRKRVYVGLYQCHLPKMDDLDIVDFNKNRGIIELGENASQLDPYLEIDQQTDHKWYQYYGAIAALGVVLLLTSFAGAASFGLTPTVILTGLVVAFSACSLYHGYETEAQED